MADGDKHGMADLEKELTCSICTDLLYQPLTLLDCLHTFCGACLKEWFQFQATTAQSLHPYTCPSCRASVRGTKPNATVTTLLDIFLQAHPGHGKSEEDKEADRKKYKPGDNVLPKLRKREDPGAEEDRRLMEEVQQMSLREVGIPSGNLEPPREHRRRERSSDRSREHSRETRHRDRHGRSRSRNSEASNVRREPVPPRSIEHQSSLRSLLSASELDPEVMGEEIMRQIMEEGLLDDIDLDNIDVEQENEISERIAQAYRRRQREKRRERLERRERLAREGRDEEPAPVTLSPTVIEPRSESRASATQEEEQARRRRHARSEGASTAPNQGQSSSGPPISRPELIQAANHGVQTRHGRSSSQGSSRSGYRSHRPEPLSVTSTRQGARSSHDLGERPPTSGSGTESPRRRMSDNQHRSALDERQQFRNNLNIRGPSSSNPNSPRRAAFNINGGSPSSSSTAIPSPAAPPSASRRVTDPTHTRQLRTSNPPAPIVVSPTSHIPRSTTDPSASEATSRASSMVVSAPATLYLEPSVSCNQCGKEHIEYELHYNCPRCDRGNYNICLGCYRQAKGCKHWYGFGWAAWARYERSAPPEGYPPDYDRPHTLTGHRYRRPSKTTPESTTTTQRIMTTENPAHRLESGVFCEMCRAFANSCYWKCDACNEGAWGFCNDCVNQGRHCTHPLLPLAEESSYKSPTTHKNQAASSSASRPDDASETLNLAPPSSSSQPTTPPVTPKAASLIPGPDTISISNTFFRPLTFTTICNICKYRPIPPTEPRFHCHQCNKGDYDICRSCYYKQVSTGRISAENGPNGWRRCPRGHRMVVVGFEDRDTGQCRVVTRDLVGGLALKEESSTDSARPSTSSPTVSWTWKDSDGSIQRSSIAPSHALNTNPNSHTSSQLPRYPPDGGIGLRVLALWSYYPEDGVTDELMFPKNAEIREAGDINGDWFWGCYAGQKGLFPANYGRVL